MAVSPPSSIPDAWRRCRYEGDLAARAWLIERHGGLVWRTARRCVRRRQGIHIDVGEHVAEGAVGLVRAVDHFDPARGVDFPGFAIKLISQAVNASIDRDLETRRHTCAMPISAEGETLAERLPDQDACPEALLMALSSREELHAALDALPERWRIVVIRHHLRRQTFRRIAQDLGVSHSRIHDIHERALGRLRRSLVGRV